MLQQSRRKIKFDIPGSLIQTMPLESRDGPLLEDKGRAAPMRHRIKDLIGDVPDHEDYAELLADMDLGYKESVDESLFLPDQSVLFYYDEGVFYKLIQHELTQEHGKQIVFYAIAQNYLSNLRKSSKILLASYMRHFRDHPNSLNIFMTFINTSFPMTSHLLINTAYEVLRIVRDKRCLEDIEDISYVINTLERKNLLKKSFPKVEFIRLCKPLINQIILNNNQYSKKILCPEIISSLSRNSFQSSIVYHRNFLEKFPLDSLIKLIAKSKTCSDDSLLTLLSRMLIVNKDSRDLLKYMLDTIGCGIDSKSWLESIFEANFNSNNRLTPDWFNKAEEFMYKLLGMNEAYSKEFIYRWILNKGNGEKVQLYIQRASEVERIKTYCQIMNRGLIFYRGALL